MDRSRAVPMSHYVCEKCDFAHYQQFNVISHYQRVHQIKVGSTFFIIFNCIILGEYRSLGDT